MSLIVKGEKNSKLVTVYTLGAYKGRRGVAPPFSDSSINILEEKLNKFMAHFMCTYVAWTGKIESTKSGTIFKLCFTK